MNKNTQTNIALGIALFTIGTLSGFTLSQCTTPKNPPLGRFYVQLLDENDAELLEYLNNK